MDIKWVCGEVIFVFVLFVGVVFFDCSVRMFMGSKLGELYECLGELEMRVRCSFRERSCMDVWVG